MSKKRKKSNKNISNNAPHENSANDSNTLNNNSNDNPVNESKIQKAQETDIYKFFKGIPPLTTVVSSILGVFLFFVVKFFYYLFHAGYLNVFNIDNSYVDFSDATYMKIALTAVLIAISMFYSYIIFSLYDKNKIHGFLISILLTFICTFLISITVSPDFKLSLRIAFGSTLLLILTSAVLSIINFLICILKKIVIFFNKLLKKVKLLKNVKKNNDKKSDKNFDNKSIKIISILFIIILILGGFYFEGIESAKNKDEFNIINDSGKQYAVISEYKDRFICVECNISDDNKTITLNYEIQKQIPIQNTEYTIYKFDDWSPKNE